MNDLYSKFNSKEYYPIWRRYINIDINKKRSYRDECLHDLQKNMRYLLWFALDLNSLELIKYDN